MLPSASELHGFEHGLLYSTRIIDQPSFPEENRRSLCLPMLWADSHNCCFFSLSISLTHTPLHGRCRHSNCVSRTHDSNQALERIRFTLRLIECTGVSDTVIKPSHRYWHTSWSHPHTAEVHAHIHEGTHTQTRFNQKHLDRQHSLQHKAFYFHYTICKAKLQINKERDTTGSLNRKPVSTGCHSLTQNERDTDP